MSGLRSLAVAMALAAGPALAKPGTPGVTYFLGIYERVGRTATAALLNDRVMILPDGQGVIFHGCSGPDTRMGFGPAFEIDNLMSGSQGGVAMDCLFHNNGYNRPILTCRAEDGLAFTLWPLPAATVACGK